MIVIRVTYLNKFEKPFSMTDTTSTERFFKTPILNSPYEEPTSHWELDGERRPTGNIKSSRRPPSYIAPVPKPRRSIPDHKELDLGVVGPSTSTQQYDPVPMITEIRRRVSDWRKLSLGKSGVTATTQRLLQHWREYPFENIRPFFCQLEAIETAIWLIEVVQLISTNGKGKSTEYQYIREYLRNANQTSHTDLLRIALKMATGSGKTSVMAMLIAWQTLNFVRATNNQSKKFTRGFLVVTPGITIKDRLRVLQPNDPDNYYSRHNLVPTDMLGELGKAKIVITNYHTFERQELTKLTKTTRNLLRGHDENIGTKETEGQMLKRACNSLLEIKNVLVINDEAHHCYREKPGDSEEMSYDTDKSEAKTNRETARLWMTGLESAHRKIGVNAVIDLSATPFFLSGSGYAEGTLFPWTVSDFSLLDAIESGIVKFPRVPVADNDPSDGMPKYRELWKHIGNDMRTGSQKASKYDPLSLPPQLQGALDSLYSHYEKVYGLWQRAKIDLPPVFIVVCNNTTTSKLVYDYIAGFERSNGEWPHIGKLELFRNYSDDGTRIARPRTLLIDSEQLEREDALDPKFRDAASQEIEQFRRELIERSGDQEAGSKLSDAELLREVMNTVGKKGRLGESIRCVVSVAMLSEGWDARTVTHVLGIRAFGTQLLCEQVVGRSLRRQSYELGVDGKFEVEYADILGVPFDFTAEPITVEPRSPKKEIHVHAVRPDRDHLEICFPKVTGYSYELPRDQLTAQFDANSIFELTPEMVGPTRTHNEGILGESVVLKPDRLKTVRFSSLAFYLAKHLVCNHLKDNNGIPEFHLFGKMVRIAQQWLDGGYLRCRGSTEPNQILYTVVADEICNRIERAIVREHSEETYIRVILDNFSRLGSTGEVDFTTKKTQLWHSHEQKSHVNYAVCDSNWELEFCRVAESHPRVISYVKNHCLGFEIPYRMDMVSKRYRPDFILRIDDGGTDLVNLIVEVKGERSEDAKVKSDTVQSFWLPGINHLGQFGRWSFLELTDLGEMERDLINWFAENAASNEVRAAHWLANQGGSDPEMKPIPRRRSEIVK